MLPTTTKATKLFKTYVLVDEDTYNRRVANAGPSGGGGGGVNPFQNPHVRETKRLRGELERAADDETKQAESVNLELGQLLRRYQSEFERAGGGGPSAKKRQRNQKPPLSDDSPARPKATPSTPVSSSITASMIPTTPARPRATSTPRTETSVTESTITPIAEPPTTGERVRRLRDSIAAMESILNSPPPAPITPSTVRRVMGGYVADGDVKRITPLLDGLARAGVFANGSLPSLIDDKGFRAKRGDLVTYIRDATITDPSRRGMTAQQVEQFADYLKCKGVDYDVQPSVSRRTARRRGAEL